MGVREFLTDAVLPMAFWAAVFAAVLAITAQILQPMQLITIAAVSRRVWSTLPGRPVCHERRGAWIAPGISLPRTPSAMMERLQVLALDHFFDQDLRALEAHSRLNVRRILG